MSESKASIHDFTYLDAETLPSCPNSALIVLNQPIQAEALFRRLWDTSILRIMADGGINRLDDFNERAAGKRGEGETKDVLIPDVVCGDLDSAKPDVLDKYQRYGTQVHKISSQDNTDLDKCLSLLADHINNLCVLRRKSMAADAIASSSSQEATSSTSSSSSSPSHPSSPPPSSLSPTTTNSSSQPPSSSHPFFPLRSIIVYGAFGGRFDHIMSAIQSCYTHLAFPLTNSNATTNNITNDNNKNNNTSPGGEGRNPAVTAARSGVSLCLVGEGNLAILLPPGAHKVRLSSLWQPHPAHAGLLPIGGHVRGCKTTGLVWNLGKVGAEARAQMARYKRTLDDTGLASSHPHAATSSSSAAVSNHGNGDGNTSDNNDNNDSDSDDAMESLSFGGLISTSNIVQAGPSSTTPNQGRVVQIWTTDPLLLSMDACKK